MYYFGSGIAPLPRGFPEFRVSFRYGDQLPTIPETEAPGFCCAEITDAGRSLSANTHDITFVFTEAVTADATGWSITVNGASKTLTYSSGSGTTRVVMQVNAAIHDGDVVRVSYDPATGGTVSVTGSLEIKKVVEAVVVGRLSRRIRFTLCDKNDAAVLNEAVAAAVLEYHGGVVADDKTYSPNSRYIGQPDAIGAYIPQWMTRANAATVTTDGSGIFDMEYTGFQRGGGFVYVIVIRSNGESLIVRDAVQ